MNKITTYKKQQGVEWFFYYFFMIILCFVILMDVIGKIFGYSVVGIPITTLLASLVAILGILFYGSKFIRWIIGFYFKLRPVKLRLSKEQAHSRQFLRQKFFSKKIIIKSAYDGKYNLFPSGFNLDIKTRMLKTFEQINIKFEERQWFKRSKLWCWVNTPENIVSIKEVIDLDIQNTQIQYNQTHISDRHKINAPKYDFKILSDGKGGADVYYKPPYESPKGGSLSLKIKLDTIKLKGQWKGRVNFKHIRGDDYQSYACLPIKISQRQVVDTPNF